MVSEKRSIPCRLLLCCLACLVLLWSLAPPLEASAVVTTATVLGVSAVCAVAAALIGIGIKPLVDYSIDAFESLVNKIVSAMPSDLLVSTYQASKSTRLFQFNGVTYLPQSVIEFVLNYVVTNTVKLGFAVTSALSNAIFEHLEANYVDYEFAKQFRYLYTISIPDANGTTDVWIWSNDTVELVSKVYDDGSVTYSRKCYGPFCVCSFSSYLGDSVDNLDGVEIVYYGAETQFPRTVTLGNSPTASGTMSVQEQTYVSSVDGLEVTNLFDSYLASEQYAFWTQHLKTFDSVAALPLSIPASIPDAVPIAQSTVVAGTATKAETVALEESVTEVDTGTATLGFLDSILSWLEKIWNVIKALIGGITTPIVNSLSQVVAAVKSVAVAITDVLTLKFGTVDSYKLDLTSFFPFCIPYDLYDMLAAFVAEPEAPVFTFATGFLGNVYTVDIDLSPWDSVAKTVRAIQLCICIVGLAFATRKFIKW